MARPMTNARDKDHYIEAWKAHVGNLRTLKWVFLGQNGQYDQEVERITQILEELNELVEKAADIEFKD